MLKRSMSADDRDEIVDFMAQGFNADFDLPLETDSDTRDRLRAMVALICISPEAHWR